MNTKTFTAALEILLYFQDKCPVACEAEQALHLGDIVKRRRARGMQEETRKWGAAPRGFAARWRVLRLASLAQVGELACRLNVQLLAAYDTKDSFHLSELTGQTIPVIMRISLLIDTILPDHSILKSMHEGDSVSTKTRKKAFFIVKMTGPAMESTLR